jgi:hypothetical protein
MRTLYMKRDAPWLRTGRYRATPAVRDLDAELAAWMAVFAAFDPNEPRDPHSGEWTSGLKDAEVLLSVSGHVTGHEQETFYAGQVAAAFRKFSPELRAQLKSEIDVLEISSSIPDSSGLGVVTGKWTVSKRQLQVSGGSQDIQHTAGHESMHAIDHPAGSGRGIYSQTPEWQTIAELLREDSATLVGSHFVPNSAGRSDKKIASGNREMFAELAAQYHLGEKMSLDPRFSGAEISADMLPLVREYMSKIFGRPGGAVR